MCLCECGLGGLLWGNQYLLQVVLPSRLPCDSDECSVDTLDVVKMQHGSEASPQPDLAPS